MSKREIQIKISTHFPNVKEESLIVLSEYSSILNSKKGTKLISEGKTHNYFYLLLLGSAKAYYIKNSKEICSWFAFQGEVLGSIRTFNGLSSNETIVLLEDSKLIRFRTKSIIDLADTNINVSHWINDIISEHSIFLEEKLYQLQFMSSEERYKALINVAPEVLQKISLTDIASYLGISRETLSRIRGKK